MGTIIIYENGQQIEVEEENIVYVDPFPDEIRKRMKKVSPNNILI